MSTPPWESSNEPADVIEPSPAELETGKEFLERFPFLRAAAVIKANELLLLVNGFPAIDVKKLSLDSSRDISEILGRLLVLHHWKAIVI